MKIRCKYCGSFIDNISPNCPNCNFPCEACKTEPQKKNAVHTTKVVDAKVLKIIIVLFCLLFAIVVITAISGAGGTSENHT